MEAVIDADPLATSIREFIAYRSSWTGTAWSPCWVTVIAAAGAETRVLED
jgi:hypothetical protein